jgi:hypothetical protein
MPARSRVTATLSALVLCALLPTPAHAGAPFTIAPAGQQPHGVIEPVTGTLHAVWLDSVAGVNVVHYCQVVRGATACSAPQDLAAFPDAIPLGQPYISRDAATGALTVTAQRYGAQDTLAWRSTTGGASWSAAGRIYNRSAQTDEGRPQASPQAGQLLFPSSGTNSRRVYSAALDGSEGAPGLGSDTANLPAGSVPYLEYGMTAAAVGASGGAVAVATSLDTGYFWTLAPGTDPSLVGNWSASPTAIGAARNTELASGPGGTFLVSNEQSSTFANPQVRRFSGGTFTPPVTVDTVGRAFDLRAGTVAGHVALSYVRGTSGYLYVARSIDNGATFTTTAVAGDTFNTTPDLALADDDRGFVIWRSDAGAVRVADLTTVAVPGTVPVPVPVPVPSTGPGPTGGTYTGPTHGTTTTIPEGTATFGAPQACVQPGQTFKVTLSVKRKKLKKGFVLRVTRVDFYIGATIVKVDRKAPFAQRLTLQASATRGATIRLRARAYLKVRKGKKVPKRSAYTTINVCR